jgi:hypothetical protein
MAHRRRLTEGKTLHHATIEQGLNELLPRRIRRLLRRGDVGRSSIGCGDGTAHDPGNQPRGERRAPTAGMLPGRLGALPRFRVIYARRARELASPSAISCRPSAIFVEAER